MGVPRPPQTSIVPPVHAATWRSRARGTPVSVAVHQTFDAGSYSPPVRSSSKSGVLSPPHTIIRLPVQTAVPAVRACGALAVVIADQASLAGSYWAPVLRVVAPMPPQTIMRDPV